MEFFSFSLFLCEVVFLSISFFLFLNERRYDVFMEHFETSLTPHSFTELLCSVVEVKRRVNFIDLNALRDILRNNFIGLMTISFEIFSINCYLNQAFAAHLSF